MARVRCPIDRGRTIAVAVHGIEPATYERCAVIRAWLKARRFSSSPR
jgi:hypothetical protein